MVTSRNQWCVAQVVLQSCFYMTRLKRSVLLSGNVLLLPQDLKLLPFRLKDLVITVDGSQNLWGKLCTNESLFGDNFSLRALEERIYSVSQKIVVTFIS